jgi:hypothetical protein
VKPGPALFSAAKLDGSLSLSIRPGEEATGGATKSHQTPEVSVLLEHRVHVRVEWGV